MARKQRPLSEADKAEAFRIATRALPKWYGDQIAEGMRDEELVAALERVLGIFGGSSGSGRLDVANQASGLKIWAGWHIVNHVTEKPLFQGRQTLAMARSIYGIADPDDAQMSLLRPKVRPKLGRAVLLALGAADCANGLVWFWIVKLAKIPLP